MKKLKNAFYKILPNYTEESLFVIAITMILTSIFYQELFFGFPDFRVLFLLIGYIFAIGIALTSQKFSTSTIALAVFEVVITEIIIGLTSAYYWLTNLIEINGFVGEIIIISTIVNLAHSIAMIGIFHPELMKPEKLFITGNADKRLLTLCTAIILIILIWGVNYTEYPSVIIISFVLSINAIIITLKDFIF